MEVVVRAFELPLQVVEPIEAWQTIRQCWREATSLANWCVQTLFRADAIRMPWMRDPADLGKPPQVNGRKLKGLYGPADSETLKLLRVLGLGFVSRENPARQRIRRL